MKITIFIIVLVLKSNESMEIRHFRLSQLGLKCVVAFKHVWGVMLERYKTFQPKPNTMDELKKVLANNMG